MSSTKIFLPLKYVFFPQFDPSVETQSIVSVVKTVSLSQYPRVQDTELQEMSDTGRCLSMHQPWASLLVEGIKM